MTIPREPIESTVRYLCIEVDDAIELIHVVTDLKLEVRHLE